MPGYNDPERGREIGRRRGDLDRLLKEMQLVSEEHRQTGVNAVNVRGQDVTERGALARAAMQYGVGGAEDRGQAAATERTAMNFGPGGAEDRQREMLKPYYESMAKQHGATAGNIQADTDIAKENWSLFDKPKREVDLEQFRKTAPEVLANTIARLGFTTRGYNEDNPLNNTPGGASPAPIATPKPPPWYLQGAQSNFTPGIGTADALDAVNKGLLLGPDMMPQELRNRLPRPPRRFNSSLFDRSTLR